MTSLIAPTRHSNRRWSWLASTALLCAGMFSLTARASALTEVDTGQVKARLVASHRQVQPGTHITVGLDQQIAPHWHTYWLNPGDSGLTTTIEWSLPAGAKAGPIQWPIPQRFELGPVTNYGYEQHVTLLTDIKVPANVRPGSHWTIEARARWLVCQDVCIPQNAHLSLTLPVAPAGSPPQTGGPWVAQAQAQLPTRAPWAVQALQGPDGITLRLPASLRQASGVAPSLWFFPQTWGAIAHNAPQTLMSHGGVHQLHLPKGEAPASAGQPLAGVLVVTTQVDGQTRRQGYQIDTVLQAEPLGGSTPVGDGNPDWLPALAMALLGGLVLNLMPCVFPVLSIKALALLRHREYTRRQTRLHGVAYTVGVLASFSLLAAALIALKAAGGQVGWGFQFQSPAFVLGVAYLMAAVGLSLSGVFTIGTSVTGVGSALAERRGYAGSFFTGVLATVVATPCTAPFMGGAMGFALTQPAFVLLSVFLSLGLGLALPYLLLSGWPALQRWLPHPGAWMERFKQLLAFPMYAAAAWLVWVLGQQVGVHAVGLALLGMVGLGFAAWVFESARTASGHWRHFSLALAPLTLLGVVWSSATALQTAAAPPSDSNAKVSQTTHWEPYSQARLETLRAAGKPVFLNFTAAWCITCLVNERVALDQDAVKQALVREGVTYLKGDWTHQDPEIRQILASFGRSGVPLYVVYPGGATSRPVVLPQLLTPDIVIQALTGAASSGGAR